MAVDDQLLVPGILNGNIEWLPGKDVGLSKDCYSDICIGTVSHSYSYIINAPGEGTQAKRRTYAYMITLMVESGVYDELGEMDELMKQYYHIKSADQKKLLSIQKQILELAVKINLNDDIGREIFIKIEENNYDEEMDIFILLIQRQCLSDLPG